MMTRYTTSQARAKLFQLMDYTNQSHDPVYIIGKNNRSVLIGETDYRAMQETLYLTSIPGMKDSIINTSQEPIDSFTDKIDWDRV